MLGKARRQVNEVGGPAGEHAALGRQQEIVEGAAANEVEQVHFETAYLNSMLHPARGHADTAAANPGAPERRLSRHVTVPHMRAYAVVTTASNQPGILSGLTRCSPTATPISATST